MEAPWANPVPFEIARDLLLPVDLQTLLRLRVQPVATGEEDYLSSVMPKLVQCHILAQLDKGHCPSLPTRQDLLLWLLIRANHPPRRSPNGLAQIAREMAVFQESGVVPQTVIHSLQDSWDPDSLLARIVTDGPIFLEPPLEGQTDPVPVIPPIAPSLEAGLPWTRASVLYASGVLAGISREQVSNVRATLDRGWLST